MKTLFLTLKKQLNVFFNYVLLQIKASKFKQLEAEILKENIIVLEKLTNTKHEHILKLMRLTNKNSKVGDNDFKFLNEELQKDRVKIITNDILNKTVAKSPRFYEPEIIDIHNENLNENAPSIYALYETETTNAKLQLDRKKRKLK